jgi:carbon-monoxide dehydrogenase medium subunit
MWRDGDSVRIGALTTHHAVETARDPDVLRSFGVLPRAARWIGHYPIRARGTIGGSLAHADATAEWCLLALLLEAQIVLESQSGRRTVAAQDFFLGLFTTAARPDEMIAEVIFPRPAPHAALEEFAQRKGDFAIVAAAVDLDIDDGMCRGGRIALGGVETTPVRIPAAESLLADAEVGDELFDACGQAAAEVIEPGSDTHGSAAYRRKLARALVGRACRTAVAS